MTTQSARSSWLNTRRGQQLLENLTAYLFLSPAILIIFIFGIFPVAFAFFVSLHEWGRFPDEYVGLAQYVKALGPFAYVLFFWIGIACLTGAGWALTHLWRDSAGERRGLLYLIPGASLTAALLAFVNWFFILLLFLMNVPVRLRGQQVTQVSFLNEFYASFQFPQALAAAEIMWIVIALAGVISLLFIVLIKTERRGHQLLQSMLCFTLLGAGVLILQLTLTEIQTAILAAQASGESLPIWSQIIVISAGVGLLGLAYTLWRRGIHADSDRQFVMQALIAVLLVVGGYLLIAELPRALGQIDRDIISGFNVTVMLTIGTVPLQLAIGLGLAVLLFQNIKGQAFFRVVYFLPYITPFVATATIFSLLFSSRPESPVNQLINSLGIADQNWLREPSGIFQLIFGSNVPDALAGPSLALLVVILYSTWVYAGYSTVIFLAGLGNIPKEMYEAAKIDGANGWQTFRFITLPLLSPTTFFLVLIATIGSFQAFSQIFLLRKPGAYEAVDTINLYILEEIRRDRPDYAYGSAMAFVLFAVILILTIVQNRYAQRRVFYG
ncbi:MAG: sugar ABC transporter permease [Anaerolineae bacterium]|nr:sugar ABC transporter permease [Anaerolineae bacterium]